MFFYASKRGAIFYGIIEGSELNEAETHTIGFAGIGSDKEGSSDLVLIAIYSFRTLRMVRETTLFFCGRGVIAGSKGMHPKKKNHQRGWSCVGKCEIHIV